MIRKIEFDYHVLKPFYLQIFQSIKDVYYSKPAGL